MTGQWSPVTPLPAPHDAVLASFREIDPNLFEVEYLGPSLEAIHAAGCIDADVLANFVRAKFRSMHLPQGTCRRKRWYPSGWRVTWRVTREHAHTLPGVTLGSAHELADHETAAPRRREVIFTRYPRPVRWTVIGKLITIDWQAVQAAAISGREAHSA